jgi:DNA-binding CsgD family transcriptional regulator/PAS domain-containing protein
MAGIHRELLEWSQLLGQLYDAVLDPDHLPEAMRQACAWLGADSSHFIGWDTTRFVPRIAVVNDPASVDHVDPDYVAHYSHIDPRRPKLAERPMGEVATCTQFFDDRFVAGSEFYQKFLIPRGRRYTMGVHLYRDERFDFYATFYHRLGREPFSAEQSEKARLLVPHLQRVAQMLVKHESVCVAAEVGESTLDALDQGMLVLDAQGDLLFANRRAEALLRDGRWLAAQGKRVRPVVGSSAAFDSAVNRVVANGMPDGVILRGSDSSAARWCSVTILRVAQDTQRALTALYPRARVMLLLTVPNAQRSVTAGQLMQLFGLTQAEARLAQALVRGQTVDDYAQQHGLALPTVRTQVRAVLDKTDAPRQQDLVRMLASLPSARAPVGH